MRIDIKLTKRELSPGQLIDKLQPESETGALVTFVGSVRGTEKGTAITGLEYSAYSSMAEKQMEEIAQETAAKWPLQAITLVHRIGKIGVGETTIFIAVEASHRKEAFQACQYLIDRLKQIVPIWKEPIGE